MNIEKRLKEIEESCFSMASDESSVLKQEIENEIEEQIKTELENYINRKEWNYNKTIEKLEKNYMKEIFKFQADCKKEILLAKKDVDIDLKKEVTTLIKNYTQTEEYKKFLFSNIAKAINCIDNKENVEIGLVSKDIEKFKNELSEIYKYSIFEIDESNIGGCIIKTEFAIIDNSLKNNIEEKMLEKE